MPRSPVDFLLNVNKENIFKFKENLNVLERTTNITFRHCTISQFLTELLALAGALFTVM